MEHVNSYQAALAEMKRILKKDGFGLLQVPVSKKLVKTIEKTSLKTDLEREQQFGQSDHVRLFGQDYNKLLSEAGFKVNNYSASDLSNRKILKYALNNDEIIFKVVK